MKNEEGHSLPLELERRLKQGIDQLRDVRETLEEVDRLADAIRPLLGVSPPKGRARAASPGTKEARAQTQLELTQAAPPSAGSASAKASETEEVPEWRKMFPKLSAEVPGRS